MIKITITAYDNCHTKGKIRLISQARYDMNRKSPHYVADICSNFLLLLDRMDGGLLLPRENAHRIRGERTRSAKSNGHPLNK
jgi:hypothetical protein